MATKWLETDSSSNVNISAATAIGAYTADADRWIAAQLFADQVAGNGDYVAYLTHQIGGAGSAYVMLPKTTLTAASGETAIGGQTIFVFVRSGDVVTVYLDGLAGDTTTPDVIVRWAELDTLRPTTADRTLDVTATGAAGVDWGNVENPTTTNALTNTTVGILATGLAAVADSVWDEAIAGHATAGSTGAALSNASAGGAGTGAVTYDISVVDSNSNPLDGVYCWATTDSGGVNTVASGYTNTGGTVIFYLDAGSYYLWRQLSGYNFTNPTAFTVT